MRCKNQIVCVVLALADMAGSVWAGLVAEANLDVDFTAATRPIRRELHSSGLGGQLTGAYSDRTDVLKPLHLWAVNVRVKGVPEGNVWTRVLDATRDLGEIEARVKDGVLRIEKSDEAPAAYLMVFED